MGLRIVFFGTPLPAARCLESVLASDHEVAAVVTAPDAPSGRGMDVRPSAVKEVALGSGILTIEPKSLKEPGSWATLGAIGADAFVVIAFGKILPREVLEMPKLGCFNVHLSLLPRWRGAAPIQWALLEGDKTSGVTVILMDEGIDTGPILATTEVAVLPEDNAGTLTGKLTETGANLLLDVLSDAGEGRLQGRPQGGEVRPAPKLTKSDARIPWGETPLRVVNRVRAFGPRPGAWTTIGGRRLIVLSAKDADSVPDGPPGTLYDGGGLAVNAKGGVVSMDFVKPEGGPGMTGGDFVRGRRLNKGDRFE